MVAALRNDPQEETQVLEQARAFVEMLRPDLLVDGHEPEQRGVYRNLSWERYLALDQARGNSCLAFRWQRL